MGGWARARPVRGMGYIRGRESYRVEVGGGLVNGILLGHPFTRTPRKLEDLIWRAVWMLCSPRQCRLLNRCLYMYVFTHVRKYTHTHTYMCIYTHTRTRAHSPTRTRELVAHILLCVTLTPLPIFVLGCRFRVFTRTKYL